MTSGRSDLSRGLAIGFIGIVIFGLTLPATRLAVSELDPLLVTAGRALIAAALAAVVLLASRTRPPPRATWLPLAIYGTLVIVSFPLLMAIAMLYAPASHGGVVLAMMPLVTALASMVVAGERPSQAFWACSVAGASAVLAYALIAGAGSSELHWADLLLAGAALTGACGYAMGGELSRRLPAWEVISWAVVMLAPAMVGAIVLAGTPINWGASRSAWLAFLYVGVFSMFLGFFAWNKGLAIGGIAKVGQIQLLQPFVTLAGSALVLGESIGPLELGFALLVVAIVALGSRMRVAR